MLNKLKEAFASLESHDVHYLIIGGIAAILYGVPRATFDLDVLIDPTLENARRLLDAFLEADLGTAALTTPEDIVANEITVFKDFVRIDGQTWTPGILFADVWPRRLTLQTQGQSFYVVSREDLIASKKAAGRNVDLEDVKILERHLKPNAGV